MTQNNPSSEKLYTTSDVARILHVVPRTIAQLCDGKYKKSNPAQVLEHHRHGRDRIITASHLQKYMQANNIPDDVGALDVFGIREVAGKFKVSMHLIDGLCKSDGIAHFKVGKQTFITQPALDSFIEDHDIPDLTKEKVFIPSKVAKMLGLSEQTVLRYCDNYTNKAADKTRLKNHKIGSQRYITESALEAFRRVEKIPLEASNGPIFTTGEAAKIMGLSQQTVIRECDDGAIDFIHAGSFRKIPKPALEKFMGLQIRFDTAHLGGLKKEAVGRFLYVGHAENELPNDVIILSAENLQNIREKLIKNFDAIIFDTRGQSDETLRSWKVKIEHLKMKLGSTRMAIISENNSQAGLFLELGVKFIKPEQIHGLGCKSRSAFEKS